MKLKAIEGIRGVACFMVVLSHLSLTFFPHLHAFSGKAGIENSVQGFIHNSPFGFIYSGTSAVYIFFVLSGYILTYVALKGNVHKLIAMSLKRYPRLMIPAVVSCILAFLCFNYFTIDKSALTDWINGYGSLDYSLLGAIYSGTVESFLVGKSSYNPVLWTMKIELIGSFIVFVMCLIRYKKTTVYIELLFIFTVIFLVGVKLLSAKLGLGIIAFIVGHLFYFYGKDIQSKFSIPLLIFGLYLAGIHNDSLSYSALTSIFGLYSYSLGNFSSGVIIVYSIIFSVNLNAFFSKKIFVFMGKVSFSVYLIHLLVISTLGVFLFNFIYEYFSYEVSAISSSVITILSTYIISIFYFNYVDQTGMIASTKFQRVTQDSASHLNNKFNTLVENQLTKKSSGRKKTRR